MRLFKPTPFLIVFGILLIFLFLTTIYYLFFESGGGMALAGTIALIAAFKCFIFITADRMVINIKNINIKAVWVVETILILCMAVYVYLNGIPAM